MEGHAGQDLLAVVDLQVLQEVPFVIFGLRYVGKPGGIARVVDVPVDIVILKARGDGQRAAFGRGARRYTPRCAPNLPSMRQPIRNSLFLL